MRQKSTSNEKQKTQNILIKRKILAKETKLKSSPKQDNNSREFAEH